VNEKTVCATEIGLKNFELRFEVCLASGFGEEASSWAKSLLGAA
jgi:hypothetical protein